MATQVALQQEIVPAIKRSTKNVAGLRLSALALKKAFRWLFDDCREVDRLIGGDKYELEGKTVELKGYSDRTMVVDGMEITENSALGRLVIGLQALVLLTKKQKEESQRLSRLASMLKEYLEKG